MKKKHGNRFNDISGQVFSRLTVLNEVGTNNSREYMWLCRCVCGRTTVASGPNLRRGNVRSCGCLASESSRRTIKKAQGACKTHGCAGRHTVEYTTWKNMLQRCTNPNNKDWKNYGGATPPVHVCKRWRKFENFLADMGTRPAGTTLSRLGDVGNYCKRNCRWHTWEQQYEEARKKQSKVRA
jgi:hypothetical protein